MQDKIIAAIAAYLEENLSAYHDGYADTLGWKRFVPGMIPQIAEEIAAAIAPLVEAGEVEADIKVDRDELYTEKFKEWREKYFKQQSNKRRFISKSNGVLYDDFGLEQKFKRAYDESAIK